MQRVRRLALVSYLVSGAACSGGTGDPVVLRLGEDTVVLQRGARVTDVHVRATTGQSELQPAMLDARPGDVLRFSSEDSGPHALVFDEALTDSAGLAFLSATAQSRGLPLLEPGAAWIVTLADAPPGSYTVRCLTHGGTSAIRVSPTGRAP